VDIVTSRRRNGSVTELYHTKQAKTFFKETVPDGLRRSSIIRPPTTGTGISGPALPI
jgi:hypothetical protein